MHEKLLSYRVATQQPGHLFETSPPAQMNNVQTVKDASQSLQTTVNIGAMDFLEIWDAEAWARYQADTESAFADASDDFLDGLL